MIVYLNPVAGTAKDNLDRAKSEMERVIGFRGKVTDAKVEGNRIAVTVEIALSILSDFKMIHYPFTN